MSNADSGAADAGAPAYVPRRVPRHQRLELREGSFACTRWGPDSDDPVLLLHGWMDCGAAWQLLADQLPDGWPLLAIDWQGHGHSSRRAGRYWFADRLAELDALLEALFPGRPARVIGHSLGGTIAMMHAGVRPERTRWLVNIEGFGLPGRSGEQAATQVRDWLAQLRAGVQQRRYRDAAQLAGALRLRNPRLPEPHALFLAATWTRTLDDGQLGMLIDPVAELGSPMRFGRAETEGCFAGVRSPVLLLDGAESGFRPRVDSAGGLERLLAALPALRSVSIPASGHLLPHERPAEVAAEIVRFAGLDGGGPPALAAELAPLPA
jgi:pimeloyl-ACP methyl ester carboxylesterase